MATMTLTASTYSVTGTVTVSNPDNMYTDASSTNYATITHTTSGTSSYYCYIKGFNFGDVPSDAEVSSIVIRIKGRESGLSTSTTYAPRLYNDTSTITGASTASTNFGTSSSGTTITVPYTGTWSTLKGYGSDLGIRVVIRRSNRNTQGYLYIYGAEIEVTYTVPVYHTITSSTTSGTIDPSGSVSILEGSDYTLSISGVVPSVMDNNIDVTSQLTQITSGTQTAIPDSNTSTGFSISNINNAYADATSTNYADLSLNGRTTGEIYFTLDGLTIPSGATILSVSCSATLQYNRNGSSSSATASCQMYSGNSAKGSSTSIISSGGTDVAKTTFNLSVGSWTASELENPRFYLTCYNGASSTVRHIYVYGVSFTVSFESSNVIYIYTIENVTADHIIVVTASAPTQVIYCKVDGSWVAATKVYKKVNGSWVEQSDLTNVFTEGVNYVKR